MTDTPPGRRGRSNDRPLLRVLAAAAMVVAGVLGVQLLGVLVPPLDDFLASLPVVGAALVVVTLAVLGGALRHQP
ncbi:MAG TPA: hypothetical protein VFK38_04385 [Candidatus Limnocylindrales bacterium]|nr:hypothetical protein [Candidatus Limnocylindrales bacterium]